MRSHSTSVRGMAPRWGGSQRWLCTWGRTFSSIWMLLRAASSCSPSQKNLKPRKPHFQHHQCNHLCAQGQGFNSGRQPGLCVFQEPQQVGPISRSHSPHVQSLKHPLLLCGRRPPSARSSAGPFLLMTPGARSLTATSSCHRTGLTLLHTLRLVQESKECCSGSTISFPLL